jgi:hypothetical protein
MNCKNVRKHLNDYVDGQLSAGLKESVDAHLQHCQGCREELEALRALRRRVRGLHRVNVSPPPDFLVRVHRRLEREGEKSGRKLPRALFRPLRIPVGIAALATAIIALIFVLNTMVPRENDIPESAKKTALKDQTPLTEEERITPESVRRAPDSATEPEVAGGRDLEQAEPGNDEGVSKARSSAEEKKAPEAGSDIMTTRALDESTLSSAPAFKGAKPFELILHLSPKGSKETRSPSAEGEMTGPEPEKREKGLSLLAERQGASKSEDVLSPAEAGETPLSVSSILPFIEETARKLGGAIISLDYGEQTGHPKSITLEIPAAVLEEFAAALSRTGELEGEEEIRDEAVGQGSVTIRILLISPREQ